VQNATGAFRWTLLARAMARQGAGAAVALGARTRLHSLGRAWAVLRAVLARKATGSPPADERSVSTAAFPCGLWLGPQRHCLACKLTHVCLPPARVPARRQGHVHKWERQHRH
jgi:hypothetical protein